MRSFPIPTLPACLMAISSQRPNGPWFDGDDHHERSCRKETRMVLLANQNNNCGWCEQEISITSSHTDHILPKANAAYANLTFAPSNLLACCGTTCSPTCGHAKLGHILASWINPYQTPNLEHSFTYEINGAMSPSSTLTSQAFAEALDAVDRILQLNHSVLKTKRERLINRLINTDYHDKTIDQIYQEIGEFKSVIEQYAPA